MLNLTNNEIREMLRTNTNMTDHDIEKHIKDGVFVYAGFEDYKKEMEQYISDVDEIWDIWSHLEKMTFDGKKVQVDFVI